MCKALRVIIQFLLVYISMHENVHVPMCMVFLILSLSFSVGPQGIWCGTVSGPRLCCSLDRTGHNSTQHRPWRLYGLVQTHNRTGLSCECHYTLPLNRVFKYENDTYRVKKISHKNDATGPCRYHTQYAKPHTLTHVNTCMVSVVYVAIFCSACNTCLITRVHAFFVDMMPMHLSSKRL